MLRRRRTRSMVRKVILKMKECKLEKKKITTAIRSIKRKQLKIEKIRDNLMLLRLMLVIRRRKQS